MPAFWHSRLAKLVSSDYHVSAQTARVACMFGCVRMSVYVRPNIYVRAGNPDSLCSCTFVDMHVTHMLMRTFTQIHIHRLLRMPTIALMFQKIPTSHKFLMFQKIPTSHKLHTSASRLHTLHTYQRAARPLHSSSSYNESDLTRSAPNDLPQRGSTDLICWHD